MSDAAYPSKIERLDETVINRIAAGEVIQRPSSAIKELIENSIDAGGTSISLLIKDGGLQLIQIQDNGHGIKQEDLYIVCERFTTSKLRSFEDLSNISTFGFRGEALASITHVSNVTITTKTLDSACAYKAKYSNGKLIPFNFGGTATPKPCAGVFGTTITVENLFFNMLVRRHSFKNQNEEYQRILEVVTKYSIHYGDKHVAFSCKKVGAVRPDLLTFNEGSCLDNIRIAYGNEVANELISIVGGDAALSASFHQLEGVNIEGWLTNANYSSKKSSFVLFINNRLVDCPALRKVVDTVYSDLLPKHSHPFVYLAISMPPRNIDVNVHPTKREVHFLHEMELLSFVHQVISSCLRSTNHGRCFPVRSAYGLASCADESGERQAERQTGKRRRSEGSEAVAKATHSSFICGTSDSIDKSAVTDYPNQNGNSSNSSSGGSGGSGGSQLIRSAPSERKLDYYFTTDSTNTNSFVPGALSVDENQVISGKNRSTAAVVSAASSGCSNPSETINCDCCAITSAELGYSAIDVADNGQQRFEGAFCLANGRYFELVSNLLKSLDEHWDRKASAVLSKMVFVGAVDSDYSVVQSGGGLWLLNHSRMLEDLLWQLTFSQLGNLATVSLNPPLEIAQVLVSVFESSFPIDNFTQESIVASLVKHKSTLWNLFSIGVTADGQITSLPCLLENHQPGTRQLPLLLLRLSVALLDWREDATCVSAVCRALAKSYAVLEMLECGEESNKLSAKAQRCLEDVLIPAMASVSFQPQKETVLTDCSLISLTQLDKLYKTFERC